MYYRTKKDLFTNGCKKTLKLVQIVHKITLKKLVFKTVYKDINVMIVIRNFNPKGDPKIYKK